MSPEEFLHWTNMYKFLSPQAYTAVAGANKTWTVPTGCVWYAINVWQARINGARFDHRRLNIYEMVELPSGTQIKTNSNPGSMVYCDPSSVPDPVGNPRDAFYARLAALSCIPLDAISAAIPAGMSPNSQTAASFPAGFSYGMIRGVSTYDLAWTVLVPTGTNTHHEISDKHQIRFAGPLLCPFNPSVMTGIVVQAANISGNGSDLSIAGEGTVMYQKLPAGW